MWSDRGLAGLHPCLGLAACAWAQRAALTPSAQTWVGRAGAPGRAVEGGPGGSELGLGRVEGSALLTQGQLLGACSQLCQLFPLPLPFRAGGELRHLQEALCLSSLGPALPPLWLWAGVSVGRLPFLSWERWSGGGSCGITLRAQSGCSAVWPLPGRGWAHMLGALAPEEGSLGESRWDRLQLHRRWRGG